MLLRVRPEFENPSSLTTLTLRQRTDLRKRKWESSVVWSYPSWTPGPSPHLFGSVSTSLLFVKSLVYSDPWITRLSGFPPDLTSFVSVRGSVHTPLFCRRPYTLSWGTSITSTLVHWMKERDAASKAWSFSGTLDGISGVALKHSQLILLVDFQ